MLWGLLVSSFMMGLMTGPHCVVMCAAPCAGVCANACASRGSVPGWREHLQLHAGRITGYAVLGAVAAATMQGIGWLHLHAAAWRPLWTLAHALILAWGVMLLVFARQPLWVDRIGKRAVGWMGQVTGRRGGLWVAGGFWAFMPCGMLYNAVFLAALHTDPAMGALGMVLFGLGTSVSLVAGASVWRRLRQAHSAVAVRMAGVLLCMVASMALFTDFSAKLLALCQ
jgi:uncharacterized protein